MRLPLPLFQRASRGYADLVVQEKDAEGFRERERRKFLAGEADDIRDDPYVTQVFAGLDPLARGFVPVAGVETMDFVELAQAVYLPMLAHREVRS